MTRGSLLRAWGWLVGLSAASTVIAVMVSQSALADTAATLAGTVIVTLAWAKARLILARYLGLAAAPFWQRGFEIVLGLYVVLLLALYLAPAL
jgi:hypothetical protein